MSNARQLYTQAESKGRFLFERLQQRLRDSTAQDVHRASVEINYRLVSFQESPELSEELQNALFYENIALEGGWNLVSVSSRGYDDIAYTNYFSPTEGRLEWSEVIFQLHQMKAARTLQPTRNLRTIWRLYIVNPPTRLILGEVSDHAGDGSEGFPHTEYRQGDSGFFALLGCPNGSGVIRMLMLIDHCNALGHKTIASVRVVNDSPPVMYFVLADSEIPAPASKSKRSQAGQERAAKRQKKNPAGVGQGPGLFGNA